MTQAQLRIIVELFLEGKKTIYTPLSKKKQWQNYWFKN